MILLVRKGTKMLTKLNVNKRNLPPDVAGLPTITAEVKYTIAPGKRGPSLDNVIKLTL